MPSKDTCADMASAFKQLCDGTRLQIFWLLCHCEECVQNISALMEMSSPAVSHHLRGLKDNGLIVSRRVGKEVFYKAADTDQSRQLHIKIENVMAISSPETRKTGPAASRGRSVIFIRSNTARSF